MPLLKTAGLTAGYGQAPVLHGIDLEIQRGRLTAVFGPNGGGKSTLSYTLAGLLPCKGGVTLFNGTDVSHLGAEQRAKAGVILVPQERNIFPNLSVIENIRLGAALHKDPGKEQLVEKTLEIFPALKDRRDQLGGTLSGGERQMVAISSAIAAGPKLLILDEPTSGLAPVLVDKLIEETLAYAGSGATILWMVGDNAEKILKYADKAFLMHAGHFAGSWTTIDMPSPGKLADLYLGEHA